MSADFSEYGVPKGGGGGMFTFSESHRKGLFGDVWVEGGLEGQRIRYGRPSVWMNGVQLPVPLEADYARSLGQHALPHVYHKEDFRKLMTAARHASAVVPLKSLRVEYPAAMYNPKAVGMACFQPPPPPPPGSGVALGGPSRRIGAVGRRQGKQPPYTLPFGSDGEGAFGCSAPWAGHADHLRAQLHPLA